MVSMKSGGMFVDRLRVTALALPPLKLKFSRSSIEDSKNLPRDKGSGRDVRNHPKIIYETAYVYPKAIERINISKRRISGNASGGAID